MPDRLRVKLPYSDSLDFTDPIAGGVIFQTYMGNGIFDPDVTSTGHQPRGYDNYKAFYRSWIVHGSSCRTIWLNPTNVGIASAYVAQIPWQTDDTTIIIDDVGEMPGGKIRAVAAQRPMIMKSYMSSKKMFGMRRIDQIDNAWGQTGNGVGVEADPLAGNQWYWLIMSQSGNIGFPGTYNLSCQVRIVYYVEFFNKFLPTLS